MGQNLPNDCEGYVQVCGNYNIQMDVSGYGIQEIQGNVCQSQEHNSLWLHFNIEESGTLGFNLIPASSSIQEDYDFWIFGPDVPCGNLGSAIRCSTTNPQAAGQANNHTGLNGTSTDISEGPGPSGDSFLQWLNVQEGEEYFLVIDRPIGNSAFTLEWTGTAVLENPLEDYTIIEQFQPVQLCDVGNDGRETFTFSTLDSQLIDNLNGIEITYHLSASDAFADINALPDVSEVSTRTYYARIENAGSKCSEIIDIRIVVDGLPLIEANVPLCDTGNDEEEFVDLTSIPLWTGESYYQTVFFTSENDALNNISPVTNPSGVQVNTSQNVFYVRVIDGDCVDYTTITFNLIEIPETANVEDDICLNEITNPFNLSPYISQFTENPSFDVKFYYSVSDRENNIPLSGQHTLNNGQNIIYVRISNRECYQDRTLILNVLEIPDLGEDEIIVLCEEEFPVQLNVISGFAQYTWNNDPGNTNVVQVTEPGNYSVEVYNAEGCLSTKNFTVQLNDYPQITSLQIINESTIVAQASSTGNGLLYSLDDGPWQQSPRFESVESGWHEVKVRLSGGCESEPFVTYLLNITNFLSPNGDGLNDVWEFPGLEEFSGSHISIFDRYGKMIYQEDGGKPFVWDGTYNGNRLPTGDYWYIINLPDGRKRIGHISLIN